MGSGKHAAVLKQIREVLKDTEVPLIERYNVTRAMALESKIGYYLVIPPWKLLCHMENRNKLGLNSHNSHRNGLKIFQSGADRSLLVQACATEMPPATQEKYQEVIDFNKRLVKASGGLLAPVTETE